MRTRILIQAVAVGVAVLVASAASAHVTLEQREAPIAASYKATFKVPHGCGDSPTLKLRVRISDGVVGVKPMPKPGWQIEVVKAKYGKSYKMFHGSVTEGAREVTWTGRLADENYDEFVLSVFLTDDLVPGRTLYFPAVQECEKGTNRWIEIPETGKPASDLRAPGLKLLPARGH